MMDEILRWRSDPNRKGLIITGSRQIGKTYILDEFARSNYDHCLHLDFSRNAWIKDVFKGDIDADTIYDRLRIDFPAFTAEPGRSVIFLDEIQLCPDAMYAIKPLVTDGRADIIASGSLLTAEGFRPGDEPDWAKDTEWDPMDSILTNNERVSPVGYRDIKRMHALDFEEYLWALGMSSETTGRIRKNIRNKVPFEERTLEALNRYFVRYVATGGMPDVVKTSLRKDMAWSDIDAECDRIRRDYEFDIMRFAPQSIRTRVDACLRSMPDMLGRDNRKFMYSVAEGLAEDGTENPGIREYRDPIRWIEGAGMACICRNVTEPVLPFKHDGSLKMYCFDTGILVSQFQQSRENDDLRLRLLRGDTELNQGAVMENAVACMIDKCGFQLNYFERNRPEDADGRKRDRIEIDFLVSLGGDLAAIEVKSGKNRRAGSLKKLRTDPRYTIYPVKRFIKFENSNIRVDENGVEHYPLFAAAFMDSMYEKPAVPDLPPISDVVVRSGSRGCRTPAAAHPASSRRSRTGAPGPASRPRRPGLWIRPYRDRRSSRS